MSSSGSDEIAEVECASGKDGGKRREGRRGGDRTAAAVRGGDRMTISSAESESEVESKDCAGQRNGRRREGAGMAELDSESDIVRVAGFSRRALVPFGLCTASNFLEVCSSRINRVSISRSISSENSSWFPPPVYRRVERIVFSTLSADVVDEHEKAHILSHIESNGVGGQEEDESQVDR